MASPKQFAALQQDITNKLDLLQVTIKSLKQESFRVLAILSRYKSQNLSDGIFFRASLRDSNFKQLEQYANLLSKQFCGKLEELRISYLAVKIELDKKLKAKPQESDQQRLAAISLTLKQFQAKFLAIWQEQHFLVLNYRLDNTAKDLERWTAVMESNNRTPETIASMVNSMFN